MKHNRFLGALLLIFTLMVIAQLGFASTSESSPVPEVKWVAGPCTVNPGDMVDLKLTKDYVYLNKEDTVKMMKYFGNPPSDIEMGSVFPVNPKENWFIIFEYHDSGHVDDKEKDQINADELLQSIKDGTEEGNKERKAQGMDEMHVEGWIEKPAYNEKLHSLAWGTKYNTSEGSEGINYECKILSREGYVAATLVCGHEEFEQRKGDFIKIVKDFNFKQGKRYSDYVPGQDKLAEYGLAALVLGGVAAKKTGLIVILLAFFKKAWLLVVALFAYLTKKFKKEKVDDVFMESEMAADDQPILDEKPVESSNNIEEAPLDKVE